jgi:D-alanyl-lipoteichoic acid acyltransferase DltB (MBOAT superfamily)
MIFNSIPFAIFFAVFFLLYWYAFKQSLRLQNLLLLAGSYFFYGWWNWRFLALLIAGSLINYYIGIYLAKTGNKKKRKWLVYAGILQGIGSLVFFKYYNFFITSFADAFGFFNIHLQVHTLSLMLPLGISFYTFRTVSYILDINKRKTEPCKDWVVFFSYVAFFPSLISGPIDKAKLLIPQLEKKRIFNKNLFNDGVRQFIWGLFKKAVVADNCAVVTDNIFNGYANLPASSLAVGAVFYMIQLYADFSGYSDMAIGVAKMLGFNITKNFNYPFFAQNIADFWRRWHISLTAWLTEYVFTPLSFTFRDYGKFGLMLAIIINFIVVGIWHGANWTFVAYGLIHGCYFIFLIIRGTMFKKNKAPLNTILPSPGEFGNILGTFILVVFAAIVFRADSVSHALDYYRRLFSLSIFSKPVLANKTGTLACVAFIFIFIGAEWLQRAKDHALQFKPGLSNRNFYALAVAVSLIIWAIIIWRVAENKSFIYFQF